ncbi:MAG: Ig-like domain repeat protein, partial [Anaerolineales bacterium]|nr:Ig-like domain repeat protein [Anaerolineales bacterium]
PAPAATLTVTQRALTVTPDDQSKIYGDVFTAFTGVISGIQNGDNITATYTSAGAPANADVGNYTITATLNDPDGMLGNYNVTLNTGTLTVTRRNLTAISDSQSKTYGDVFTAFTGSFIGIQNSDNITATYDSLGAPATAPFGSYPITITLVDPDNKLGNYTVTQNIGTLTVNRRDLSFIPDDQSKIYGDTFSAFTGTVNGLQNGDAITPIYSSPGAIATAPVGTYPITITLSDPTNKLGNYNFTIGTATLTVTQRDLVVTPDDQVKQYGTWFIAFTGTISGIQNGDNITANYASAGSPPSAAVGTYPITATLNDPTGKLGNYNVTLNTGTLTVTSSVLTVTANNQTITYGNPDPIFTFTYTGFASGDGPGVINTPPTCSVSGPHTDVGTYPIVCSGGSDDAYTFVYVDGTLTVQPRALIVTPTDKTKVYGDVFTAFTGLITGIQFGDNITATYASAGAPATANVGDYPITATLNDPDHKLGNYTVTLKTGTLSGPPRALTVTPADKTKIYGAVFTAFTGTITGVQAGDTITVTYDSPGAPATAVIGDYPINATLNDPGNRLSNYTVTLNVGTLSVTPRALVVTPDNKSKLFGTVFTAFTGTITGIQNGDNITAIYDSPGAPAAAPVGTYPITATLNDPDNRLPNYTITLNTGTLSVGLSILTISANDQSIVYGSPDPVFTFTYSGFVNGDTPAVVDTPPTCQVAVPHNNVGAFPITCSGGIDDNYVFAYTPGTLTVTPRTLTVTPDNKTKIYGDTFTAFTGVISGIQGGDIITANYASAGAIATAGIGSYPITATLNDPGGRLGNYTVTLNTGTLTVNTRGLVVTPTDASKVYGSVFNAFTGTIVGIQNGDPITATYASPGSPATAVVGTYPITATLNAPAGVLNNYTVTANTGTLTVTQRDLTVTPADKSKVYGTVFTAFTGTITGIQNSDPITVTYASAGAPAAAAVGDYPITATLNDPNNRLPNYNVILGTGTLSVTLASTLTGVTSDNNPAGVGDLVTFTATVTSSAGTPTGTITFYDGANSMGTVALAGGVATISTNTLNAGSHTITAVYSGDANFAGSTSAPYVQGVGQTVSNTVVTSNANPSVLGQSV